MRSLYLALVTIVAALVAGFLLLPRFLDNDASRAQVEKRIAALAGRPVDLRGNFDLSLLPSPKLSIGQVTIGNPLAADESWVLTVDRIDLDVTVASLFIAKFEITASRLVRPILQIREQAFEDSIEFGAILQAIDTMAGIPVAMIDASISLPSAAESREIALHSIDMQAIPKKTGNGASIKVRGQVDDRILDVTLETRLPNDDARRRFSVNAEFGLNGDLLQFEGLTDLSLSQSGTIDADGSFELRSEKPGQMLALADRWRGAARSAQLLNSPVSFKGKFQRKDMSWSLADATLNLWQGIIEASASGGPGVFAVDFESDGLVLPDDADVRLLTLHRRIATAYRAEGEINGRMDATVWRKLALDRLQLTANLAPSAPMNVTSSFDLPGSGTARLSGTLDLGTNRPAFDGRIEANTQNAQALAAWLGYAESDLPLPIARASIESTVRATINQYTFQDLVVRLDASRYEGSVILVGGDRLTAAADLKVDRLDLDELIQLLESSELSWRQGIASVPDLAIDIQIQRLKLFDETMRDVAIQMTADANKILIRNMRIDRLFGGRAGLTASIDRTGQNTSAVIDMLIEHPSRIGRLLELPAPAAFAVLGPVSISAQLQGDLERFGFDIQLQSSKAKLAAKGTTKTDRPLEFELTSLAAESGSFDTIVRLLGKPISERLLFDRAFAFDYRQIDSDGATGIELRLGDASLHGALKLSDTAPRHIEGELLIAAIDDVLSAEILFRAQEEFGVAAIDPRSWFGDWPQHPLPPLLNLPFSSNLDLALSESKEAEPWLRAHLRHEPDHWLVDDLNLKLKEGSITGGFAIYAQQDRIATATDISVKDGRLRPLLAELGVESGVDGIIELNIELFGTGRTAGEWARALRGHGDLAVLWDIEDGTPRIDDLNGAFAVKQGIARLLNGPKASATRLRDMPRASLDMHAWMIDGLFRSADGDADIRVFGPIGDPEIIVRPDDIFWYWGNGPGGP